MTHHFQRVGRPADCRLAAAPQHSATDTTPLVVTIEKAGSSTSVCLRGTLDTVSASAYDSIIAAAGAPTRQLNLDLNGLEAATRAGCRAIHVAAKLMHRRGSRVKVFGARPNVMRVLKNTGFDNLMDFHAGEAQPASDEFPVRN